MVSSRQIRPGASNWCLLASYNPFCIASLEEKKHIKALACQATNRIRSGSPAFKSSWSCALTRHGSHSPGWQLSTAGVFARVSFARAGHDKLRKQKKLLQGRCEQLEPWCRSSERKSAKGFKPFGTSWECAPRLPDVGSRGG